MSTSSVTYGDSFPSRGSLFRKGALTHHLAAVMPSCVGTCDETCGEQIVGFLKTNLLLKTSSPNDPINYDPCFDRMLAELLKTNLLQQTAAWFIVRKMSAMNIIRFMIMEQLRNICNQGFFHISLSLIHWKYSKCQSSSLSRQLFRDACGQFRIYLQKKADHFVSAFINEGIRSRQCAEMPKDFRRGCSIHIFR